MARSSPSERLRSVSDLSWRLLLIGAAVVGAGIIADRLRLVLIPMFVAALLVTVLSPPVRYLEQKGLRPLLATWVVFALFLGGTTGAALLLVRPIVGQSNEMGPALSDAVDDVETWLVDGPMGLSPQAVADARTSLGDQVGELARGSGIASAVAVGEVLAGAVLALALTFFAVKDARLLQRWALAAIPVAQRSRARAAGAAVSRALRGYLRGSVIIGSVEAVVLAIALTLVGADLPVVVGGLTFMAAFFPFIGAIAAGLVAVLVALVSGGTGDAAVIAIVALLVQQFDNELLAPVIYGRATRLHPIAVLLAVTTGATVGGIAGAFVAVPLLAATSGVLAAVRASDEEQPMTANGPAPIPMPASSRGDDRDRPLAGVR